MYRFLKAVQVLCFITIPVSLLAQNFPDSIQENKRFSSSQKLMVVDIIAAPVFYRIEHTIVLQSNEIKQAGAITLSDAISKLPGMSQLSTGAGISKPVIRGLYGNRIQVNVMGLRFDNQQWQDEHGLGLSDMGVEAIEVLKGASALSYGSEAIGGVVNILDKNLYSIVGKQQEWKAKMLTNTLGFGIEYGIKNITKSGKRWQLNISAENNADYSSSKNVRVLNSRFDNYAIKASKEIKSTKWQGQNNLYAGVNRFGFVFDSLSRKAEDARLSRTYDGPHHRVFFTLFGFDRHRSLKNNSFLNVNGGIISNLRQEQEGGNRISLNMWLNTFSLAANISNKRLKNNWVMQFGASTFYQINKNLGSRIIIPDANTIESGAFVKFNKRLFQNKLFIETGLRMDMRSIKTLFTDSLFNAGMPAFQKNRSALNGSINLFYNLVQRRNLNSALVGIITTGYRSGNLAELSSNGLHEGTNRWEVGNPNLKLEQNVMTEVDINSSFFKLITLNISLYRNQFFNYIYLAPSNNKFYGIPIYNYAQSDAKLQGGEITLKFGKWKLPLSAATNFSWIDAKKQDGNYLPFIPPFKFYHEIKWKTQPINSRFDKNEFYVLVGYTNMFSQTHPSNFETSTPAYNLINASLGKEWKKSGSRYSYSLSASGTNLTDVKYFDHLSRFKYFGIYNIGRNIVLNFSIKF
jgi:iron complex outermembrane receptor protein